MRTKFVVVSDLKYNFIRPMHEENILGSAPKIPLASFSFSLLKVGIPLVKINIDFQEGISTFKNETKTGQ